MPARVARPPWFPSGVTALWTSRISRSRGGKGSDPRWCTNVSSNWKELSTLRLTLVNLKQEAKEEVAGTTVFYFRDNLSMYWVASSGSFPSPLLHTLIEEIRLLGI